MSISVSGRIKMKKLNSELYKKIISEYPLYKKAINIEDNDFSYIGNDFGYDISFIEKKAPTNIWDSDILGDEYEYSQIIIFDLYKEMERVEDINYNEAFQSIIDFFIFLNKEIASQILVTSDVHNDICYIDKDIRWSESWLNRNGER